METFTLIAHLIPTIASTQNIIIQKKQLESVEKTYNAEWQHQNEEKK